MMLFTCNFWEGKLETVVAAGGWGGERRGTAHELERTLWGDEGLLKAGLWLCSHNWMHLLKLTELCA